MEIKERERGSSSQCNGRAWHRVQGLEEGLTEGGRVNSQVSAGGDSGSVLGSDLYTWDLQDSSGIKFNLLSILTAATIGIYAAAAGTHCLPETGPS